MNINVTNTGHAYYIVGPRPVRDVAFSFVERSYNLVREGNPDFFDLSFETLTIDDARNIKSLHSTRPVGEAGKKIFILTMNNITVEAQNALLKLLEEPAEYAHFFLIVSSAHLLLPTVKSRMQELKLEKFGKNQKAGKKSAAGGGHVSSELLASGKKFVTLAKSKRLDEIKKLVDEISKEKKTKQDAIDYLNAIQAVIYEEKGSKDGMKMFEVIETARKYLNDSAPSVKMLLEYVALNI